MGKLIESDDFCKWLLETAITDEDRCFCEKVKYAVGKYRDETAATWIKTIKITDGNRKVQYQCNSCEHRFRRQTRYCPNCGKG